MPERRRRDQFAPGSNFTSQAAFTIPKLDRFSLAFVLFFGVQRRQRHASSCFLTRVSVRV